LVGALDPSFGVGHHTHVQLGVCCTGLVVPFNVRWGSRGVVQTLTSEVARISYRSGCGSVSRSLGRTITTLRYALNYFFSLYIFYVKFLGNNLKFNFQAWPFEDADSQPLLGYRWTRITNVTSTVEGCYMTYLNAFDCITSRHVRQHLFTYRIFGNINKCQKFAGYLVAI
jgi:hypothetical protein